MLASISPASADVRAGITAWQAGNYGAAVAEWRPLAERGDADAQFNLGQAYKVGKGVPLDLGIAQSWYQKAAQQGHPQAQANLGLILFQSGNRAGAMPWIKKAADNGDARAQYVLGTALFNGDLLAKDWPRAYGLMTRAAAQGLAAAATNLSEMDKIIPLAQRQQGIQLARQMERGKTGLASIPVVEPAGTPRVAGSVPRRPVPVQTAQTAPRPAPQAAAPIRGGGWRVQLGAFGNSDNARRHWEAVSRKAAGLRGLQPMMGRAGAVTRLQAGPVASRAVADRVCASVRAAGSACFPVAP